MHNSDNYYVEKGEWKKTMLKAKRRAIILLVISFLLALVAGFMYVQKMGQLDQEMGEKMTVYVAAKNIASRKVITQDDIETIELPKKYVTSSHITKIKELQNKVSVVPLSKGDLVTKNMLKQAVNLQKENTRLVTLQASEKVGFDQAVESLDRVDIVVSDKAKEGGVTETTMFMKDVPVVMVSKDKDKFLGIAVEVPVEEATKLIHAQNYAQSMRILKANVGKG